MIFNFCFHLSFWSGKRQNAKGEVPAVWQRIWAHQPHEDRGTYHTDEFLGMVLIMEVSFGAWYLLCSAASADGTYYGLQCQTMVLMCDLTFLQIGRA